MKAATAGLIQHLNTATNFMIAELFTIFLVGGTTVRYCTTEDDIITGTNLLLYSDQMDNAAWTKLNVTITANASISPHDTLTMDRVTLGAGAVSHTLLQSISTPADNSPITHSWYVRYQASLRYVYIEIKTKAGTTFYQGFDLLNGTLVGGGTCDGATISELGGGLYRITASKLSVLTGGTAVTNTLFFGAYGSYTGSGEFVDVWGGQTILALAAGNYAETTSAIITGYTFTGVRDGPILSRTNTRTVIGVEVDTMDMTVAAQITHLLAGKPWLKSVREGGLDGALIKLEKLFMPTWGDTSLGSIIGNTYKVGTTEGGRTNVKLACESLLTLLNVQLPRNPFQPGCRNTLFDGACKQVKANYANVLVAGSGSTTTQIQCTSARAAGYFSLGTITFGPSTANPNVTRTIKVHTEASGVHILQLVPALPIAPAANDAFTAYPGCDRLQSTCSSGKFATLPGDTQAGNLANFRGEPYVPRPDSIT